MAARRFDAVCKGCFGRETGESFVGTEGPLTTKEREGLGAPLAEAKNSEDSGSTSPSSSSDQAEEDDEAE